jgi:type VI secretion system protein ImpL
MAQVADDVTREMADSDIARTVQALRTKVTLTCEDVITSRYPFARASRSDVALADFARMFAPNGLIDQFFTQNMADAVDSSGTEWRWREDTPLSRQLGPTALADFQRAAQIRDTFFAGEGGSPGFTVSITPAPVNGARMEIDNTLIAGRPGNIAPVSVQWPGNSEPHHAAVVYDVPGRTPAHLEMNGPWALYRLLDAGQLNNEGTAASFVLGGRDLRYRFESQTPVRPLNLGFLRSFHCPNGI